MRENKISIPQAIQIERWLLTDDSKNTFIKSAGINAVPSFQNVVVLIRCVCVWFGQKWHARKIGLYNYIKVFNIIRKYFLLTLLSYDVFLAKSRQNISSLTFFLSLFSTLTERSTSTRWVWEWANKWVLNGKASKKNEENYFSFNFITFSLVIISVFILQYSHFCRLPNQIIQL